MEASGRWRGGARRGGGHPARPPGGRSSRPASSAVRGGHFGDFAASNGPAADENRAGAEEVGDERRLAVQARVRGLADALRVTPLAQQAAGAVRAHFRLQEGESAEKAELQVVGYGIGSFCASGNAALQLALLVALLEELRPAAASQAEVFDPVMSEVGSIGKLRWWWRHDGRSHLIDGTERRAGGGALRRRRDRG